MAQVKQFIHDTSCDNKSATQNQKILLRGGVSSISNSKNPLCILNGVKIKKEVLDKLNPDDVESVNVFKSTEATALYGSEAANGVIIITTKKQASKKPNKSNPKNK